jgi:hypothetical protein
VHGTELWFAHLSSVEGIREPQKNPLSLRERVTTPWMEEVEPRMELLPRVRK